MHGERRQPVLGRYRGTALGLPQIGLHLLKNEVGDGDVPRCVFGEHDAEVRRGRLALVNRNIVLPPDRIANLRGHDGDQSDADKPNMPGGSLTGRRQRTVRGPGKRDASGPSLAHPAYKTMQEIGNPGSHRIS